MAVDERSRLQLADAAKRAFGHDAGLTLMELLPPVGWADVARQSDVARLELALRSDMERLEGGLRSDMERLELRMDRFEQRFDQFVERLELKFDAKFERGFRQVLVTVSTLMVTGFAATIAVVLAR